MNFRAYDKDKDRDAVFRIWREIGWLRREKHQEEAFDLVLGCSRAMVACIAKEAESAVTVTSGTLRYLEKELPFACVTGVGTSHIARKQGFAKKLLAQMLALEAAEGAVVAGLGIFDQGFYNELGFGNGAYEHWVGFDPSSLKVSVRPRVPRRLRLEDWKMLHASRLARRRAHGVVNISPPEFTRSEINWWQEGNTYGLGYCDAKGKLTHYIWISPDKGEHGPFHANPVVFQTGEQFMELMALVKSLGDQVHLVRMREPAGIQLQDLLQKPIKHFHVTKRSDFENRIDALAYWQVRILDLQKCLAHTRLRGGKVRFNLKLTDPIERYLPKKSAWRGISGNYVVDLDSSSGCETGADKSLPTLTASVGAFSRLWLGVRPATSLCVTDDLSGPTELLKELDWLLRLPEPKPDWDF